MKNKFLTTLLMSTFVSVAVTGQALADDSAEAKLNAKTDSKIVKILSIEADKKKDADNSINHERGKKWGAALGGAAGIGAGVGASFIPGAGGAATGAVVSAGGASGGVAAGQAIGGAAAPEKVTVEAVKMTYQLPDICKEKHGKEVCKPGKVQTEQFVAHLCDYKLGQATVILDSKGHERVQPNTSCKVSKKSLNKK